MSFHLLLSTLVLSSVSLSAPVGAASTARVSASDPAFRYAGRFDTSDPAGPVVIWQASRITVGFEGTSVILLFEDIRDQAFFDATIDGTTTRVDLRQGQPAKSASFSGLKPGRHTLELFKRSEAAAGTARFRGIVLDSGSKAFVLPAPTYALRMQFFGDSITVGACNEDGAEDQWDDRSTHNNTKSYGALTAAAFQADTRNIAVSGMGISEGYVPFTVGQIWDRVYPSPDSPRANLSDWTPDVVFVNYGENDDSFTKSENRPFPASFAEGYTAVIRAMRATWPNAHIVLLRGGMFGGAKSEPLREAWESAVAELERTDPRVSHLVFTHWSSTHPRVTDHRAMADELIAWVKTQPFITR